MNEGELILKLFHTKSDTSCRLLTIIDNVDNRQNISVIFSFFSFCKMKPLKNVGDGKQLEDKYHCGSFSWLITKIKL